MLFGSRSWECDAHGVQEWTPFVSSWEYDTRVWEWVPLARAWCTQCIGIPFLRMPSLPALCSSHKYHGLAWCYPGLWWLQCVDGTKKLQLVQVPKSTNPRQLLCLQCARQNKSSYDWDYHQLASWTTHFKYKIILLTYSFTYYLLCQDPKLYSIISASFYKIFKDRKETLKRQKYFINK